MSPRAAPRPEPAALCAAAFERLHSIYGEPACPLEHADVGQLLVAAILSAQCSDARVNAVCKALFARYPDISALAGADVEAVAPLVRPVGLHNAKARSVVLSCRAIRDGHGGRVPDTMEELLRLPGVGRKTANIILSQGYGKPGFAVDTHVGRVLTRLGAVSAPDPARVEAAVAPLLPPERLGTFSLLLIAHGRAVCRARAPACGGCALADLCARAAGGAAAGTRGARGARPLRADDGRQGHGRRRRFET